MSDSHTVRCIHCPFIVTSDDWITVREEARIHEDDATHRVQVYPTAPIIAPLPRGLWAG